MRTITLELDERIYSQVVDFLRLLPKDACHVLDDDEPFGEEELKFVAESLERLEQGDDGDFTDWDSVKGKL